MKNNLLKGTKIGLTMLAATLSINYATAGAYTAVASGNWSNTATWGGAVPHFILNSDQITIGTGIVVTMDSTIEMTGTGTTLALTGTLTSTTNSIIVAAGTFSGAGTINANGITMYAASIFSFSGTLTANIVSNSIAALSTPAVIMVNKTLTNSGILTIMTSGSLTMGASSNINVKVVQ